MIAVLASVTDAGAACSKKVDALKLDWNGGYASWASGAQSRIISVPYSNGPAGTIDVSFAFSGATGQFNDGYPGVSTLFNGGQGASQNSLGIVADFSNNSQKITLTATFPYEVDGVAFTIFDIDFLADDGTGGFRDFVSIAGKNTAGGAVSITRSTPYYTPPSGNVLPSTVYTGPVASPFEAIGNSNNSANNSDYGNMTVSFNGPVRSFTITYQNGPDAYAPSPNPQAQGIGLYDLSFCRQRGGTTIETSKTISVYSEDPVGCDQMPGSPEPTAELAIPGACVEYVITTTNIGPGNALDLAIVDDLPTQFIYSAARFSGFSNDGPNYGLTTPATGQDCAAASCAVTLEDARLDAGQTGTIEIRAIVK